MALCRSVDAPAAKDVVAFAVLALGVGGVVGGVLSYVLDPLRGITGGLLTLAIASLVCMTRVAYGLLRQRDEREQSSPRIVISSSWAGPTNWIGYEKGEPLGKVQIAVANFSNTPEVLTEQATASGVVARVEYFDSTGKVLLVGPLFGRWQHREHPASLKPLETFDRLYDADFPVSGIARGLLLALKPLTDDCCYAVDNQIIKTPADQQAIADRRLVGGHFRIRVGLRGPRVHRQYWLTLLNQGANADLQLAHDP